MPQSARAAEYTDCISAKFKHPPAPIKCSGYDTKQSDGEAPIILELWGMQNTPLLPSLPSSLWCRVLAPVRILSMGQIELSIVLMLN